MSTGLGEIILYRGADGGPPLDVRLERETVGLNQRQMAEPFDKDTDTVGHLVAMTLLIAKSRPDEKDVLTRVVVNLINRRNP